MGGLPLNAEYTFVDVPYVDAYSTLMQGWSVNHKTDANAGLIKMQRYNKMAIDSYGFWIKPTDVIFGQEMESFNQKSGLIQSGINTMQTTFVLECHFQDPNNKNMKCPLGPTVDVTQNEAKEDVYTADFSSLRYRTETIPEYSDSMYEVRAYFMYDKIIAMDETVGSIRAEY